jgi:hypothetical protein
VGKPEGNQPLRRPRHRLKGNIKMDLTEIGWGGKDWPSEHVNEPSGSIKCWEILKYLHNWWFVKEGSTVRS